MEARDLLLVIHIAVGGMGLALGPLAIWGGTKCPGRSAVGLAYFWAVVGTSLTAFALVALNWSALWWLSLLAGLSVALALAGLVASEWRGRGWTRAYAHGQGGTYIALVTATLVVSVDGPAQVLAWVLPPALGLPLIERWVVRLRAEEVS